MVQVSIIIPGYNEEKDIGKCISSLQMQSFFDFEMIIVDDGSIDKTVEIVKSFQKKDKRIKLIKGNHKGPGFSRNLGANKSKGKILVFIDSDMTFDKDYLKNLIVSMQKDKNLIGTTHDYEIANNLDNLWSRCWGKNRIDLRNKELGGIFRAIRKDKFLELGGFDSKYGYADDQTFWLKYKVLPYIAKNTTCYHKNPETLGEVYKQSRWIGASINLKITNLPIIKYFIPFIAVIASPVAIPILLIKKCYKNKNFKLFFPWMFIFMSVRYFGTIAGIFRKIYFNKNMR